MLTQLAALILGLLQGVLEWLPISSRGNLILFAVGLLGVEPAEALELSIYLHIGTGLAAVVYFRREILRILSFDSTWGRRLLIFLLIATLMTGVLGFPLFLLSRVIGIFSEALLGLTGAALILNGIVQRFSNREGSRTSESLMLRDGLLIGSVQGVSAMPGISRSGITTAALLFSGFSGEEALRISFLMSIPATFAANLGLVLLEGAPTITLDLLTVMVAASFAAGLVSIDLLLRVARRVRFWSLCILLGVIALLPFLLYIA